MCKQHKNIFLSYEKQFHGSVRNNEFPFPYLGISVSLMSNYLQYFILFEELKMYKELNMQYIKVLRDLRDFY